MRLTPKRPVPGACRRSAHMTGKEKFVKQLCQPTLERQINVLYELFSLAAENVLAAAQSKGISYVDKYPRDLWELYFSAHNLYSRIIDFPSNTTGVAQGISQLGCNLRTFGVVMIRDSALDKSLARNIIAAGDAACLYGRAGREFSVEHSLVSTAHLLSAYNAVRGLVASSITEWFVIKG